MKTKIRKRHIILGFSIFVLFVSSWLTIFLQRKQHLIGGGINRTFLFLLINAHLVLSLIFFYLIVRQSIKLYFERRKQVPGSAFKRNLFFAFIIFSLVPVSFVFFIAGKLITTSIDNWFQVRLGTGLESALVLHEEQTVAQRIAIKKAIKNYKIDQIRENYEIYVWGEKGKKFIGGIGDEVNIWRKFRKINDRSTKSLREDFFKKYENSSDEIKIFDFYGSLYSVKKFGVDDFGNNKFLIFVHRYPENIRNALISLQDSIGDYSQLKSMRNPIYWNYFLTFLLITLLVLFLSIWCAFFLARGISKPIQELLLAVKKVRSGNLDVHVKIKPTDDLKNLVNGFNEMTQSLKRAYKHLEFRNTEMMTMLEHIKESVFFINNHGRILSFNAAGRKLIEKYLKILRFKNKKVNFLGSFARDIFFSLVRELDKSEKTYLAKEITFSHEGEAKTFMIYLTVIQNAVLDESKGILVVMQDLSEVYKMNKIKTWQEAAKQMAHEVKNPLTPIQLATQRLQRKLRKQGCQDPVLMDCADTILHQVKIIKDLVGHFSEFAKMPDCKIEQLDINEIIMRVGPLYEMSYPQINFSYDLQNFLPAFKADRKKMKRVLVNLLDNSVRVLEEMSNSERKVSIKTSFKTGRNQIELIISDNGPGIPKDVRQKLFLPYVSSGNKNMGLGLAIVHDIVRQNGGSIKLLQSPINSDFQGAIFQILLPV